MQTELILENLELVELVAKRIVVSLPASIDLDDLISEGVIGLMDAAKKYKPSDNNTFKTYAEYRIRGAILDSLRDNDVVPHAMRRRINKIEKAKKHLRDECRREPTTEELAQRLNLSVEKISDAEQAAKTRTISFDQSDLDYVPARTAPSPHEEYCKREESYLLEKFVNSLPEQARECLSQYFFGETTMLAIGDGLGVTESRVCQVIKGGIKKLKNKSSIVNILKEMNDEI